jgi:hypothetical protein
VEIDTERPTRFWYKHVQCRGYIETEKDALLEYILKEDNADEVIRQCILAAKRELRNGRYNGSRSIDTQDVRNFDKKTQGTIDHMQIHYLNMRSSHIYVNLAETHIVRIKYNPVKKKWLGMESSVVPGQGKVVPLQESWVRENFSPHVIKHIKCVGERGKESFLETPVGDVIEVVPTMDITMNPIIKYCNNEHEVCAFAAYACVLNHFALLEECEKILSLMKTYQEGNLQGIMNRILQFLADEFGKLKSLRRKYMMRKIGRDHNILDISTMGPKDFKLVVLHQSDGSESHAIATTIEYIFDSNCTNALPLSTEALNCCCGATADFEGIKLGYYFQLR